MIDAAHGVTPDEVRRALEGAGVAIGLAKGAALVPRDDAPVAAAAAW